LGAFERFKIDKSATAGTTAVTRFLAPETMA